MRIIERVLNGGTVLFNSNRVRLAVNVAKVLASGGNRQNKFIENRQNWIIEKDQTTQFWLIS